MQLFIETIDSLTHKHAPLHTPRKRSSNLISSKNWMTGGILTSIKKRDNIHKRYLKCKDACMKENILYQYKQDRNLIVTLWRNSKSSFHKSYFQEHKSNLKKVWNGIKSVINCNKANTDAPTSMIINNKHTSNPDIITTNPKDFF